MWVTLTLLSSTVVEETRNMATTSEEANAKTEDDTRDHCNKKRRGNHMTWTDEHYPRNLQIKRRLLHKDKKYYTNAIKPNISAKQ